MTEKSITNRDVKRQKQLGKRRPWRLLLLPAWFLAVAWGYLHFPFRDYVLAGAIPITPAQFMMMAMGVAIGIPCLCWLIYQYWLMLPASPAKVNDYQREQHRLEQRRLTPAEARQLLLMKGPGLPLASLAADRDKRSEELIGLEMDDLEGHTLVVGNTGSGKGTHLTETLLRYPGAMLIIDPKGEQYERTAGYRQQLGPVYNIPQHTLDLADYYDLGNRDDVAELHYHLMKPWADRQPVFADKCKVLFTAAYNFAVRHSLNPIQVLFDAADSDPAVVLTALATVDRDSVMAFGNGRAPDSLDRMSSSAWGTFATRMYEYQAHVQTVTTRRPHTSIPLDWAAQNATIYITYSFDQLKGVGGVVSAIVAALLRHQMKTNAQTPALIAVDELPTVGLRNVAEFLAIVRGYKLSLLLYIQAYSQLADLYSERGAETILSNCQHQVWYPAVDEPTAKRIETLYGTELRSSYSLSRSLTKERFEMDMGKRGRSVSEQLQKVPALESGKVSALDEEEVILRVGRKHLARAYRLWPIPRLATLPGLACITQFVAKSRRKVEWEALSLAKVNSTDTKLPDKERVELNNSSGGSLPTGNNKFEAV